MFTETTVQMNTRDAQSTATAIQSKIPMLNQAIQKAQDTLLRLQKPEGFWVFELEADCSITAEYIIMMHYLDEINHPLQKKIAVYLRSRQTEVGFYPLFTGGEGNLSTSVKVYYALKMAGDSIDAP
ncbi:MAG: squalene--hopene cyclase, partial [Methylococcales bacterium]|nr:squalene--hopene cyclase [Methylococcales bacterium]